MQAVYKWIWKFREQGIKSLRSTTGRGVDPRLNEEQFKELIQCLRRPATALGYATDLWSGPRVRHLIKKLFKIEYHRKHMPRFLRRLGLQLKKLERRALEQDSKAVRQWKNQRLPEILAYVQKIGPYYFMPMKASFPLSLMSARRGLFPKLNRLRVSQADEANMWGLRLLSMNRDDCVLNLLKKTKHLLPKHSFASLES